MWFSWGFFVCFLVFCSQEKIKMKTRGLFLTNFAQLNHPINFNRTVEMSKNYPRGKSLGMAATVIDCSALISRHKKINFSFIIMSLVPKADWARFPVTLHRI